MSHITNQGLVEAVINEYMCQATAAPKTVRALTALLDSKDAERERLLNIARGCHDYGGGYHDVVHAGIYHHGIQTVVNALEAATKGDSLQTRILESIGARIPRHNGDSVLADVALPTYCGCSELLQNLQELETHVERGCWKRIGK